MLTAGVANSEQRKTCHDEHHDPERRIRSSTCSTFLASIAHMVIVCDAAQAQISDVTIAALIWHERIVLKFGSRTSLSSDVLGDARAAAAECEPKMLARRKQLVALAEPRHDSWSLAGCTY